MLQILFFVSSALSFSALADINPYKNSDKRAEFNMGYTKAKLEPCKDSPILGPAYKRNESDIASFRTYTKSLNGFARRSLNDAFISGITYGKSHPIDCKTAEPLPPKAPDPISNKFHGALKSNGKEGSTYSEIPENYKTPELQAAYYGGYELGKLFSCRGSNNIYQQAYDLEYNQTQKYRTRITGFQKSAYLTGFSHGFEKPIDCTTGKNTAMPGIYNETTLEINKEKLVTAITSYYNIKGEWAGKYTIANLVYIRIEDNGPAFNAHVKYKTAPVPNFRGKASYDQRIFSIVPQDGKYAVISMAGYMSAKL